MGKQRGTVAVNTVFIFEVLHATTSTLLCLHLLFHKDIGHKYLGTRTATAEVNVVFIFEVLHATTSTLLCLHLLVHRGIGHKYIWEQEQPQQQ